MALNLADRMAVRQVILTRCEAAVTNYALYILGNVNATQQQLGWAREAIRNPKSVGDAVSYHVLNQPAFIDGGSGISDANLTGAIENAINAHFIPPAPVEE
jgi:hypothetical protein